MVSFHFMSRNETIEGEGIGWLDEVGVKQRFFCNFINLFIGFKKLKFKTTDCSVVSTSIVNSN